MKGRTTSYFTKSDKYENQYAEIKKAKELGNQVDKFEEKESGYTFDSFRSVKKVFDTII